MATHRGEMPQQPKKLNVRKISGFSNHGTLIPHPAPPKAPIAFP
jgi:hypothetical protein